MSHSRRPGLAVYAGLIALSAYGGAIGLATGRMDTRGTIDARLPLQSPVFGAIALALIVGVPNTIVACLARRHDARTGTAAILAGVLLVGWIAVEMEILGEFSWLQPLYIGVGASLIVIGGRRVPRATSHGRVAHARG